MDRIVWLWFLGIGVIAFLYGDIISPFIARYLKQIYPEISSSLLNFLGIIVMVILFAIWFQLLSLYQTYQYNKQNAINETIKDNTDEEYQDESQSTTNEDMDFAQNEGLKSHNKQRATNSENVEAILERCRQKLEAIEWGEVNIKAMMEDLFHKKWDISGGFGHTQQEAIVLGKSIINFVGFEYSFVEYRTFAEYFVFQEMENKLVGYRFQTIKQRLYHGENGKHYDQIIISVSATPLSEFKKLGLDFSDGINEPELHKLQDSHKVGVINFEVVCWFDITNHFGKDGPPFL